MYSFTSDIYRLAEMIGKQKRIYDSLYQKIIYEASKERMPQLYADHGSDTDYQWDQSDENERFRSGGIAMDFWASLEHKIYYKFEEMLRVYQPGTAGLCGNHVKSWMRKCCH